MRLFRLGALALATAILAVPAHAGEAAKPSVIPTADLATVAARGAEIYAFDQAAWHSTDAMVARKLPRESMRAIRGWVVEPAGDLLTVTYYGLNGASPYAIYVADYRDGKVVGDRVPEPAGDRSLSAQAVRMAAAHDVAVAQPFGACVERPFNTVTLPPRPGSGIIPVYLLTPMLQRDAYPFGGHHEVDVGSDGRLLATRDFSKSCVVLDSPADTKGLWITHLLDPHPTEMHVYLSLWSRQPVFVGTPDDAVWSVNGTRIEKVGVKKGGAKKK
ncbi:hypothetical protein [Sphingomonas sp.]|uniref:hypothetical protein n=1 Tax=Sphingomonas sp. TaxID=28214 RepID=UPI003D6D47C9